LIWDAALEGMLNFSFGTDMIISGLILQRRCFERLESAFGEGRSEKWIFIISMFLALALMVFGRPPPSFIFPNAALEKSSARSGGY
jgi:hypothetical protein